MTRDEVVRHFWARFLESKIGKDDQVSGFESWWSRATDHARKRGMQFAHSCWIKLTRDKRDLNEVIAAGVAAFRADLRMTRIATESKDPDYAKFRFELRRQIGEDGLRPFEVAALLEQKKFQYPAILDDEIDLYREWDKDWGGPIEPGRPVWNPKSKSLEPWPHVRLPEPHPFYPNPGPEVEVGARLGEEVASDVSTHGQDVSLHPDEAVAPEVSRSPAQLAPNNDDDDQPPPPEYAQEGR